MKYSAGKRRYYIRVPRKERRRESIAMEDTQIIDLIYDRNQQGLAELDGKYRRLLLSVADGILHSGEDSEECVSDAYLKVWNVIPPYRPKKLGAFVCKILRNAAIDRYRHNSREKRGSGEVLFSEIEDDNFCGVCDEEISTLSEEINLFLEGENAEARVFFTRRYFLCEDIASIATRFEKSENYVSLKLFRTREKLRKFLLKRGYNVESR